MALCAVKVTEKAVSRLAELVPTYKEKLQDEEVFKNFMVVVGRTKSFATVEMKEAVAEWEAQLRKVGRGTRTGTRSGARGPQGMGCRTMKERYCVLRVYLCGKIWS